MKLSEQWLREWFDSDITIETLLERLTMAGLEVEDVQPAAPPFNHVIVAEVLSVEPHPDADRLKVCRVNAGQQDELQIVCGANNVRAGIKIPLAQIGAVLPNGLTIKKSKLRGVESYGMLCSEAELGIADTANGLFELPETMHVGEDIRQALALDDRIIELAITPNRGDCFSISGLARDCAALTGAQLKPVPIEPVAPTLETSRHLNITLDECPRYWGRIIKGVDVSARTPLWMIERLRRSGLRSVNVIVDITNYVMLELGQPMHVFDNSKLQGAVQVRYAQAGETLLLLDEKHYALNSDDIVIADEEKAVALAGVMGGAETAIADNTVDIFLESAFFKPEAIIGKARRQGLHTDASHRFERGVDFECVGKAMQRASQFILEICGGQAGLITEHTKPEQLPLRESITLRNHAINRLLGITIDSQAVQTLFTQLGMHVRVENNQDYTVTAPSWRFDINIEADLIEEIARVQGYDAIPEQALTVPLHIKKPQLKNQFKKQVARLLVARGYQESINYSFISSDQHHIFSANLPAITLANPIAADLSVMRSSLLPGLLKAMDYNLKRQRDRVRLFELGLVFTQAETLEQTLNLAGVACGSLHEQQWGIPSTKIGLFDVKADLEHILALMGVSTADIEFKNAEIAGLHPGQTAEIFLRGKKLGMLANLHPTTVKKMDLEKSAIVFELTIDGNLQNNVEKCFEISKFPSIRRDLSIVLADEIPSSNVVQIIKKSASSLLSNLQLIDVYQGEHIDIGKKSLTFGLTFQRSSSTLTDSDVEKTVNQILQNLEKNFQAKLRES